AHDRNSISVSQTPMAPAAQSSPARSQPPRPRPVLRGVTPTTETGVGDASGATVPSSPSASNGSGSTNGSGDAGAAHTAGRWAATGASASASWPAVWNRSAGSLAISLRTTADTAGGTSPRDHSTGSGSSVPWRSSFSTAVPPG